MMASSSNGNNQEEIKCEFLVKEGRYKVSPLSASYSYQKTTYQTNHGNPVKLSMVTSNCEGGLYGRLVYNYGRELFTFAYKESTRQQDTDNKILDKKAYKSAIPLCHDFNLITRSPDTLNLIVGFNTGQMQLINVVKYEIMKNFNESRNIDNSKITCIKWIPGKDNLFIASYFSGNIYMYDDNLPCSNGPITYSVVKESDDFSVYTSKSKLQQRNPIYKWTIGKGAVNDMAFSPDCRHLATVSQDGFMRVINYETNTVISTMKSYFGGLLCVAWSSDGKCVATGGEDDLVTVWSFTEGVVIARCDGHRSWVNAVAFDPYTIFVTNRDDASFSGSEDEANINCHRNGSNEVENSNVLSYRIGSVGQDTQFLLWDIGEDILTSERHRKQPQTVTVNSNTNSNSNTISRASINDLKIDGISDYSNKSDSSSSNNKSDHSHNNSNNSNNNNNNNNTSITTTTNNNGSNSNSNSHLKVSPHLSKSNSFLKDKPEKEKKEKKDKWDKRFGTGRKKHPFGKIHPQKEKVESKESTSINIQYQCPSITEIPLIEPIVARKIAHERVTSLAFTEDCITCASQDGQITIWIRPNISTPLNTDPANEGTVQSCKSSQTSQSSIGTVL
ncbi:WD repeat-containing protein 20 [Trichoplax sp. H2]|nr:WD repeat-containing protein 20 [Trichoplax sp. H2]|eukprot:RDD44869.1 WD repeat-containing protein 20 [Trichoplax sp. H2]